MQLYVRRVSAYAPAALEELLQAPEAAELCAIPHTQTRGQRLAAAALTREVLAAESGLAPQALQFQRDAAGKPHCVNAGREFNRSHSGDYVAVVTGDRPVGVDIERIRPLRPGLVRRVCTAEECAYVGVDEARFIEIWVLKEAYFKCMGIGLAAGLQTVSFAVADGLVHCSDPAVRCALHAVDPAYRCATCELR